MKTWHVRNKGSQCSKCTSYSFIHGFGEFLLSTGILWLVANCALLWFAHFLIWRLSKAPAYSSVSLWILHMFLKRLLHRNGDRPHHMLWRWCCVWLLPSQAKCTVISPFTQTKWYQPHPVGQFKGPAGILHIVLSASKSSFSSQESPGPERWCTLHPHPHVLPSLARPGAVAEANPV